MAAGAALLLANKELPPDVALDVQRLWAQGGRSDFARLLTLYGLFPLYRGYSSFESGGRLFVRLHRPPLLELSVSASGLGARATLTHLLRPLDCATAEAGVVPRAKGANVALDSFRTRFDYTLSARRPGLAPRGSLTLFNRNSFRMREWEVAPRGYWKGLRWRQPGWPEVSLYLKESHKDFFKRDRAAAGQHPRALALRAAGPTALPLLFDTFDAKLKVDFARSVVARCALSGASLWEGNWPLVNYLRVQRAAVLSSRPSLVPRRLKGLYTFEGGDQRVYAAVGGLAELGWRIHAAWPVSLFGFCSATAHSDGSARAAWGGGVRVEVASALAVELLMRSTPTLYGVYPFVVKFNFCD